MEALQQVAKQVGNLLAPKNKAANLTMQAQQELDKQKAAEKMKLLGKIGNIVATEETKRNKAGMAPKVNSGKVPNANIPETVGNTPAQGPEVGSHEAVELNLSKGGRRRRRRATRKTKKHTRKHKKTRRTKH